MHNSGTLQLSGYELPHVPQEAFDCVTCLPGKCAVEMADAPDQIGNIYLPDKVSGRLRCDVGVVLSVTPPKNRKNGEYEEIDIKAGDGVLMRPYHGTWFDGFQSGGYKTDRRVAFLGVHGDPSVYQLTGQGDRTETGVYEVIDWNESIVAKLVGNVIVPTIGNLMIRLENTKHEFLALPDKTKMPTQTATVVGPGSSKFKRGEKVVFQPEDSDLTVDVDEDLRIVRISQIEAVITRAA